MLKRMFALAIALVFCASALAAQDRELTGYFRQSISRAADEIGGLSHTTGEEYADCYEDGRCALRGNGGLVQLIELKAEPSDLALCGVKVGMKADEVRALMSDYPLMWEYDEELAYTVRPDEQVEANSEMLVVFFDEDGAVNGAWYRAAGL